MTNYYEIVAALLVALILTFFFSTVLKTRGPWGALWLVFLIIFLATWAGHLWINPVGPTVLGVSIAPVIIIGFIFAFILASVSMRVPDKKTEPADTVSDSDDTRAAITIGVFFWIVLIILLIAIAAGYYRMPVHSEQLIR